MDYSYLSGQMMYFHGEAVKNALSGPLYTWFNSVFDVIFAYAPVRVPLFLMISLFGIFYRILKYGGGQVNFRGKRRLPDEVEQYRKIQELHKFNKRNKSGVVGTKNNKAYSNYQDEHLRDLIRKGKDKAGMI